MAKCQIEDGAEKIEWHRHVTKEKIYVLRLTEREAESLRMVFCAVGGKPTGRRGDIDRIKATLDELGLTHAKVSEGGCKTSGAVTFNNGE